MSQLINFRKEERISRSLIWGLNQLLHFLPKLKLVISLTVEGDEAEQQLLSAYARGVRHLPGSILDRAELY